MEDKISKNNKNTKIKKESFEFNLNLDLLKKLIPIFLILIVMLVAFQIRSGPINLNGLNDNIKANTYANIKNLVSQQVSSKYPNLPQNYKNDEINKEYNKIISQGFIELQGQKINLRDIISRNSMGIKNAFKADNGQTYLVAIDPYYWLRLSSDYLLNGFTGNKIINGEFRDNLRLAPNGIKATDKPNMHISLEAFLMKINGINKNSTIGDKIKSVYLIPVIFAMLSAIPCFLIIRRFTNNLSAFFGSLVLVSIGTFVSRTIAGFVDTDAYNIFFPLLITSILVYGFLFRNIYLTILMGLIAGFFQGIFAWAWSAGWFIFVFITISLLGYLGFILVSNIIHKIDKDKFKSLIINDFSLVVSFIFSSYIFTKYFVNANIFSLVSNGVQNSISSLASVSATNIWPNVLSTVAELNPASFGQILASVGGKIVFMIGMIGIIFLSIDFKSKNTKFEKIKRILIIFSFLLIISVISGNFLVFLTANHSFLFLISLFLPVILGLILNLLNSNDSKKVFLTILLSVWMSGTIYMSLNGIRFILLLAPAFAISFGIGLYYIYKIINNFFIKEFNIQNKLKKNLGGLIIVLLLFLTFYLPMFSQAENISKGTTPSFDDNWYSAMQKIENNSKSNAIITSWWDFGHFFITASKRGTTFDGGSQTSPASHWVGKLLLENNESKSLSILKMLTCGNNKAFDTMLSFVKNGDNSDAVKINKIIYSTFGTNRNQTRKILENNKYYTYDSNQIEKIMSYLNCKNPAENFLITSGDMVGKTGVWAHWGSWDFTKKYVYDNYKTLTANQISKNIDENLSLIKNYFNQLKNLEIKSKELNIKKETLTNQWLADYPSYIPIQGRYLAKCLNKNNTLICQNSLQINLKTGKVKSSFNSKINFRRLIFPSKSKKLSSLTLNKNGKVDIVLVPGKLGESDVILMQYPLGESLFTKLFFLKGFGTSHFNSFVDSQSITGNKIKIWKVNWNNNNNSINNINNNNNNNNLFGNNFSSKNLKFKSIKFQNNSLNINNSDSIKVLNLSNKTKNNFIGPTNSSSKN